jgi:SAM-dependent methyltransferase
MSPLLYGELVPWYGLLDPPEDHADEANCYADALGHAGLARGGHVLELGAGAGHNALFMKDRFQFTLTDLSEPMLGLSRALNPECEHAQGDMRTLRLGRRFDAVFVHDAIVYMSTRGELQSALATAFEHTKPGGLALFAPDSFADGFVEQSCLHEGEDGSRALRCLEWNWDPNPDDEKFCVEYAFLLRDGDQLRAVHDRHEEGLFSREAWLDLLRGVGFRPELIRRPLEDGGLDQMLLARRPA